MKFLRYLLVCAESVPRGNSQKASCALSLADLAPSSRPAQAGFTLIELLVSMSLGLLILGMALTATISSRNLFRDDIIRTRINQNIRSALDIIALHARQAGESLESSFPAIIVVDGGTGPDQLILRRNLYENEVLNVCENLTAGVSNTSILVSNGPANANANCRYTSGWQTFVNTWSQYRQSNGNAVPAYLFNRTSRAGEFINYLGETDTGTQLTIGRTASPFQNSYTGDGVSAALYLIEELRFRLNNGVIELVINEDETNVLNVVDGISTFSVQARLNDSSVVDALGETDDWTLLQALQIEIRGEETSGGTLLGSTVRTDIFPRNILSH